MPPPARAALTASPPSAEAGQERRSEARERLVRTASRLFYGEGIRAVGVERIIVEAPVTRATFYRHFPSKEDLVLAYLRGVDAQTVGTVQAAVAESRSPADAVRRIGTAVADDLARPDFRGCAFLKAAAEYSDPDDPVRRLVLAHRDWYRTVLTELFSDVFGDSPRRGRPEDAAQHFVMMRDGVMTGAHLDGVENARAAFRRGVEGVLTMLH